MQVFNRLVVHRSSRAKKVDAFFNISTSPRSCLFSSSSCLTRWCSAVSGLPMPLCPDCSASNWLTQRLTALSPSFMSLHTWLMLKPWALTIWTTCSLKSVSKILLDFGLLTVHAISVFNNLSGCLFLLDHHRTIAMVRMRSDARTRDYVAKRTSQGLSKKEIHRCLKRYIVRELYPLIPADLKDSASPA